MLNVQNFGERECREDSSDEEEWTRLEWRVNLLTNTSRLQDFYIIPQEQEEEVLLLYLEADMKMRGNDKVLGF